MHGHSHSHGCDGDDTRDDTPEMGLEYSLYTKIDLENMECLNESVPQSGKSVFKPWEERLDGEKFVESDVDEELLFNIPFTGNIKLKGIIVIGGEGDNHPSKMRLFKNKPNMSFDDVGLEADQEFEMHPDRTGHLEYATRVVKFSSVHNLSLHFPSNFGSDSTKITYIGLRGEFSEAHRHGVTICTYEARPNMSDHKADLSDLGDQLFQKLQIQSHDETENEKSKIDVGDFFASSDPRLWSINCFVRHRGLYDFINQDQKLRLIKLLRKSGMPQEEQSFETAQREIANLKKEVENCKQEKLELQRQVISSNKADDDATSRSEGQLMTESYLLEGQEDSDSSQLDFVVEELEDLRRYSKKLDTENSELQAKLKNMNDMEDEIHNLRKRTNDLASNLEEESLKSQKVVDELRLSVFELLEDGNSLRAENTSLKELLLHEQNKVIELKCSLADSEDEMKITMTQLEVIVDDSNNQVQSHEEIIRILKEEIEDKNLQLKAFEDQLAEMPAMELEIEKWKNLVEDLAQNDAVDNQRALQEELQSVKAQLLELPALEAELDDFRLQLTTEKAEKQKLQQDFNELRERYCILEKQQVAGENINAYQQVSGSQLVNEMRALDDERGVSCRETNELISSVNDLIGSVGPSDGSELSKGNIDRKDIYHDKSSEEIEIHLIDDLRIRLEEEQKKVSNLTTELELLRKILDEENTLLQTEIKQLEEKIPTVPTVQHIVESNADEILAKNSEFEKLKADLIKNDSEIEKLKAVLTKNDLEIEKLKADLTKKDSEIEKLNVARLDIENETNRLREVNDDLNGMLKSVKDDHEIELKRMQSVINNISDSSPKLLHEHSGLIEKQNIEHKNEVDLLKESIKERDAKLDELQQINREYDDELKRVESLLKNKSDVSPNLSQDHLDLIEKLKIEHKQEINLLEREIEVKEAKLDELQKVNRNLEVKLSDLQSNLPQSLTELNEITKQLNDCIEDKKSSIALKEAEVREWRERHDEIKEKLDAMEIKLFKSSGDCEEVKLECDKHLESMKNEWEKRVKDLKDQLKNSQDEVNSLKLINTSENNIERNENKEKEEILGLPVATPDFDSNKMNELKANSVNEVIDVSKAQNESIERVISSSALYDKEILALKKTHEAEILHLKNQIKDLQKEYDKAVGELVQKHEAEAILQKKILDLHERCKKFQKTIKNYQKMLEPCKKILEEERKKKIKSEKQSDEGSKGDSFKTLPSCDDRFTMWKNVLAKLRQSGLETLTTNELSLLHAEAEREIEEKLLKNEVDVRGEPPIVLSKPPLSAREKERILAASEKVLQKLGLEESFNNDRIKYIGNSAKIEKSLAESIQTNLDQKRQMNRRTSVVKANPRATLQRPPSGNRTKAIASLCKGKH